MSKQSSSAEQQLLRAQTLYREAAERSAVDGLTPADVIQAPAEFDHELVVRAVGPAIVVIIEREAPVRHEVLAATQGEAFALREWVESTREAGHVWAAVLDVIFADDTLAPDLSRVNAHSARLDAASRIQTLRVGGDIA